MKYYSVLWGLFHKPLIYIYIRIPCKQVHDTGIHPISWICFSFLVFFLFFSDASMVNGKSSLSHHLGEWFGVFCSSILSKSKLGAWKGDGISKRSKIAMENGTFKDVLSYWQWGHWWILHCYVSLQGAYIDVLFFPLWSAYTRGDFSMAHRSQTAAAYAEWAQSYQRVLVKPTATWDPTIDHIASTASPNPPTCF